MSNPYKDDRRANFAYPPTSFLPDSPTTSLGSVALAVLAGAYVSFKVLELLGFPVRFWLYLAAQMSYESLPSLDGLFNNDADSGNGTHNDEKRGGTVMENVLGFGSGLKRGFSGALSKNYRNVPPGLGNWDNSCYQNSVIQGLASLPSLREYLSNTTTEYPNLSEDSTNSALFDLIKKLNNPEHHGQQFWIRGKLKAMTTFQQQDAQEYYSKIMDALDKEVQDATKSKRLSNASWLLTAKNLSDSLVTAAKEETSGDEQAPAQEAHLSPNPLDGLLAQRVGCINCGHSEGLSLIPFNCLTVPLGRRYSYDVRECLDEYTHLEFIQGVECAKCTLIKTKNTLSKLPLAPGSPFAARLQAVEEALEEEDFEDKTLIKKCGTAKKNWVQTTKSRQAVIARAPKSLVLHVNRSVYNERTGDQLKNNAKVSYPKILDLNSWCLGSRPSQSQSVDESVEEWPKDPNQSMIGDADVESATDSPYRYILRAAVTHKGSHGNGHYICYRNQPFPIKKADSSDEEDPKDPDEEPRAEEWWRLSDENVYSIKEEAALLQGDVFMLFYEHLDADPNPPLLAPTAAGEAAASFGSTDIPLPPQNFQSFDQDLLDHQAAQIPLPADDDDDEEDVSLLSPPESPSLPHTVAHPTFHVDHSGPAEPVPGPQEVNGKPDDAYPTPPPDSPRTTQHDDTETSEGDSDDAPSTALTSDEEGDSEADDTLAKDVSILQLQHNSSSQSPHWMRTAGDTPGRGEGSRAGPPMVTAT
ncbi:cysteine proteinase [Pleomassaria siparia CBS 279.74]|uniref:ubiquitinyl hydrolase 1 n=1 Tax=Pleomassaria siparia CBS 279.74 TaxID=1314801 RepID=A0A6G1JZP0_9PLEO|nr:cysteine proteinase [Pleomassaria siparia CBS 279.74]